MTPRDDAPPSPPPTLLPGTRHLLLSALPSVRCTMCAGVEVNMC